ncbi:ferredoxin hydrogenase small subunit [Azoarcus olearius]|uniref:hydrogenase (acceptor) n=1 Tax=Azoarcus sp. (strain BH72) TaxID=418699 RepID=A1KC67_AZOSB|nr:ferredoxin hydrogenase small subunit [Azoarcus olearius]ANQ86975.1 ferredoxin hydrogenase small subunit [Azoarcus olearius]CAL96423.1 ferredoxin hydrogenase, small subunit [Azoarcus olearius]
MNLIWLQSGGCGGCTMSLLCSDARDLLGLLRDAGINILWHPSLSEQTGPEALALLEACANGEIPLDLLCVEGAMLRGPAGSGRFHVLAGSGKPMIHWVEALAARARHTLAIGSCAAWGGISAGGTNPTEACGLQYEGETRGGLLGAGYRGSAGLPVINVAGCPTHPGWVVDTLLALALGEFGADALDALARPRFYADQLVHHGCSRNEFYEFKASAEKPSDLGCMMEHLGCKGTQAHADCNLRPWNGSGSCTSGGYACISCTEPGFETPGHPFAQTPKVAGIPIGLPSDMPKAWFVALAALSKSATPRRVRENATADHPQITPAIRRTGLK